MTLRVIKQTETYYNKFGQQWTDRKTHSFHHEKQFQKILSRWPQQGAIIDIGCAHGIHVPLFLGMGRKLKYLGIDISTNFLKTARRRYPQLTFLKADIADTQTLPKKKFDGFWAAAVLMHVPHELWNQMFTNIEHIIKPGGFGYISLPIAHPSGESRDSNDVRHFTILTETEQRVFLKQRKWRVVSSGTIDGFTSENVWRWYIVQLP